MKHINGHELVGRLEGERAGGTTYYACKNPECEFNEHQSDVHLAREVGCPAKKSRYTEKDVNKELVEEPPEPGVGSVVRDWVTDLSWKQQTVLLSAIRGCDGVSKHDTSKAFVRPLRGIILNNAEPGDENDTFMNHPEEGEKIEFAHDLDDYPMHWVVHFLHAVEIVGYKHPDEETRLWWNELYNHMVREGFHLDTESETQLDTRLQP